MRRRHHCHIPDLFLYSMSNPVMMLLPSNLCVHRKFILRAFTSRISSSGGSGGSWGHAGRLGTQAGKPHGSRGTLSARLCTAGLTRRGWSTLDSELDQASVLAVGVDGVTGEEDGVPAVGWFQLPTLQGEEPIQTEFPQHCPLPSPAITACCHHSATRWSRNPSHGIPNSPDRKSVV